MSASIPTILPKLLALAGSSNPHEATTALRMARAQLRGDWSVVTDRVRWMADEERLGQLLDKAATAESDQSVKALADAQRLMRKVPGLDFQFLSRKVAELQKAPARPVRVRSPSSRKPASRRRSPPPARAVTPEIWAEVFAEAVGANRERAAQAGGRVVKARARRPARPMGTGQQLSFDLGDCVDVLAAA